MFINIKHDTLIVLFFFEIENKIKNLNVQIEYNNKIISYVICNIKST